MNEDSILTDFQLQFNSPPHTPPQHPHIVYIPYIPNTPSSNSSSDSEDGHQIHIVPLDNPFLNLFTMPEAAVSGGQLSSIPQFSGNQGLEGLVYAEAIDRAKTQFGWTEAQAATAAVSRGGNAVSNWIRGEKAAGTRYTAWNMANPGANDKNLREPLLLRFGPKYTTGGAVAAIADLKQRPSESVAAFMDRVKISVDMLNYNVTEANRNQAFREAYVRLVIAQFGGGVQEDVREKVFGVADPPATIEDVLKAATAVENEKHAKATKLVVNVVQEEQDSTEDKKEEKEKDDPISALQTQMKEVLAISRRGGNQGFRGRGGRGRGQGSFGSYRCYGCGQLGHIREQCTATNQAPFRGRGGGRGGRGYSSMPHMTRRGQFRSNFGSGRGRPIFPVSEFSQFQDQEDWAYENYWPEQHQDEWGQSGSGNDYWGGF